MPAHNKAPAGGQTGVNIAPPLSVNPTATGGTTKVTQPPATAASKNPQVALPGAAEIAAKNKPQAAGSAGVLDEPPKAETMTSAPAEKDQSVKDSKSAHVAHLSAPASAIPSGTATPAEPAHEKSKHEAHLSVPASAIPSGVATPAESGDAGSAAEAVEGTQVGDGKTVQEQDAKAGGDAAKSVED